MKPKKSLGQHFLTSTGAIDTIIDAGDVVGDDVILEIGPGRGVLTEKLLFFGGKVIALEKDTELITHLQEKFNKEIRSGKLDLLECDALEFDPQVLEFYDSRYKLIANIPYYITGEIIRKFLEATYQPERTVLMVQKEVAERIVAKDDKESILSISVKAYGTPHYIKTVKAGSFFPVPNVDSAILSIDNISKDFFEGFSEKDFFNLLHAGFKSKRKKLSSNLSPLISKEKVTGGFETLNIDPNTRAEDVSINTWKQLAQKLLLD